MLSFLAVIYCLLGCFFFFFSSRRRHTRCSRDWSSDVCSSDLMVFLASTGKDGGTGTTFSYPDYLEIRKETRDVFSDVSALQMYQMDGLSVDGKSQPMWAFYVASNFFDLIDIKPALGRFILPSEGQVAGAGPVLVLSYSYWKSRFNADPGIVGKKASVNGQPVTIIGVAPESFHGLNALLDTQGYLPVGMAAVLGDASNDFLTAREPRFTLVARLKPDANLRQADSAMQVVSQRLTLQNAKADAWLTLRAIQLGPVSMSLGPAGPRILALASALFLILAASILDRKSTRLNSRHGYISYAVFCL